MYYRLKKITGIFTFIFIITAITVHLPEIAYAVDLDENSIANWTIESNGDSLKCDYDIVKDEKASGDYSLRFVNKTSPQPFVYLNVFQTVYGIRPNTNYECSIKIKGQNVSNFWWGPSNFSIRNYYKGTDDWKTFKYFYKAPTDATSLISYW